MKLLYRQVAVFCVSLFLTGNASAQIVFPPPDHLAKEAPLTVMVYVGEKDPKTITLKTESGEEVKGELVKGFSRWETTLQPGKNTLQWGEESRSVFLASGTVAPPEGFTVHVLHEALEDCENCHAGEGQGTTLRGEVPALCYECHDDPSKGEKGNKESVHSPVTDGDCLACHQAHTSLKAHLLDAEVPALCLDCHDDVSLNKDGKAWAAPHDPVQSGDCLDCHQAHAADAPALAKADGAKLCADCHDDPTVGEGGEKKKVIHEPVGEGECSSCHQIHGSEEASLLTMTEADLCKECHEYPLTSEKGEKYKVLHEPADSAECLSCHEAHASEQKGLIKKADPDLCFDCHDNPSLDSDGKPYPAPHEALNDGCLACHKPHGSDFAFFLPSEGADFCLECHDDVRLDKYGFNQQYLHLPVEEGKCGACHQPHGSAAKYLLADKGNAFCLSCHKEPHKEHRVNAVEGKTTVVPNNFPLDKNGRELACRGCHAPHGSEFEKLFVKERVQLCVMCHIFGLQEEEDSR